MVLYLVLSVNISVKLHSLFFPSSGVQVCSILITSSIFLLILCSAGKNSSLRLAHRANLKEEQERMVYKVTSAVHICVKNCQCMQTILQYTTVTCSSIESTQTMTKRCTNQFTFAKASCSANIFNSTTSSVPGGATSPLLAV